MQLIVLGMHRSGTSVLARLLNMMGAYFGPEGMSTGANSENPKGFWERKDVRALNDFVLQSVGCDWNRVSAFDIDTLPADVVDEFMARAGRIVLEMDAHRPWFMKEPRLCLLLALWRRVLEEPVCIHIHRSPVEVAASLQTRNQIPIEVGLLLWQHYVVSAHAAGKGLPAVAVAHRELMTAPMDVVSRLHRELGNLGVVGLREPLASEVASFVKEELYRERELRDDLRKFRDAPQVALHQTVAAGRRPPARLVRFDQAARAVLEAYESGLPPVVTPKEKRRADAERKEQALARDQALDAMLPAVDGLKGALESQAGTLQRILSQAGTLEQALEARAGTLERAVEAQAGTLERAVEAQAGTLEQALQAQAGMLGQITTALEAGRAKDAEQAARIEALVAENTELRNALAARDREAATRARELVSLREQFRLVSDAKAAGDRALEDRFREIAQLTRMLEEAELGLEAYRQELAGARKQLEGLTQELVSAKDDLAKARSERASEVATLLAKLVARQQEVERMEAKMEQLHRKRDLLEARTRAAREVVAQERATIKAVKASRSWRITRPVRWATGLVRGGPRRRNADLERDRDLVRASGLFDDAWYLVMNPAVRDSGVDPVMHYLVHGAAEGRDPSAEFNTRFYLDTYPDVANARANPLVHYILHGATEDRATKAGPER